ncbi:hypothetical protein C8F01DRAFT_1313340 [Mycena amicta]|nr:hypothetical protein C8F01DRAFT_1313340 [Mycena amicta]
MPTTRTHSTFPADADAEVYEEHLKQSELVALDACPSVQVFVEGDGGQRQDVSDHSAYTEVKTLARTVLGHLVASSGAWPILLAIMRNISRDDEAKKALDTKLGHAQGLEESDIIGYLVNNTPTIVIKNLEADAAAGIAWGRVHKGKEEGAEANEVFLSKELADALRQAQPPTDLTQAEVELQRARQTLLWSTTLLHETCHALTKFFFSASTIMPKIGIMVKDGKGHGEVGWTFELHYIAFLLQCSWHKTMINTPDRMWRTSNLLASPGSSATKILSAYQLLSPYPEY